MLDILKNEATPKGKREVASKQLILETAIDLGQREGWKNLTVRRLASKLKYAPPVLYQFYKNKDDLTKAIIKYGFNEMNAAIKQAVDNEKSAADKLLALGKARYHFSTQHRSLHGLMFSPDAQEWHRKILAKNTRDTHTYLGELIQSVSGRNDNCTDLILNYICLVKGYTFFTNEINPGKHKKHIVGDLNLPKAFEEAMIRYIKAIQINE